MNTNFNIYVRFRSTSNSQIYGHFYFSQIDVTDDTVNDVTPVRECFWSNDGVGTRPDSRWGVLDDKNAYVFYSYCRQNPIVLRSTSTLADLNPNPNPNPNPDPNPFVVLSAW